MLDKKDLMDCLNVAITSPGDYCRGWNDAVDAMPKWNSVEERLPESGKESLVLICYRNRNYPAHPGVVDSCYYDGRMAECGVREFERINEPLYVTHWMPMPLPPKENPQ